MKFHFLEIIIIIIIIIKIKSPLGFRDGIGGCGACWHSFVSPEFHPLMARAKGWAGFCPRPSLEGHPPPPTHPQWARTHRHTMTQGHGHNETHAVTLINGNKDWIIHNWTKWTLTKKKDEIYSYFLPVQQKEHSDFGADADIQYLVFWRYISLYAN